MRFDDSHGFFAPVTEPMPIPTDPSRETVDRLLRFNHAWTPYVLSMLAGLIRPEMYIGASVAEFEFALREAHDLVGAIENIPVAMPDWDVLVGMGADYSIVIATTDNYQGHRVKNISAWSDAQSAVNMSVTGFMVVGGANAGGQMKIKMWHEPDAPKVFTLYGVDCFGQPYSESGFTPGGLFQRTYNSVRNFVVNIDAINLLQAEIRIEHDATCFDL